ncbi:uncharacterized protein LOC131246058 [Magnolia sinica]|uniref:uncharacterized protein LOC131246058 n=1 Tax=Magnolia sinica TaxID=86752 RepID=UPI00265ADABF|nr:uncharacterized protein LOC131246058 [Magnolia sinica]
MKLASFSFLRVRRPLHFLFLPSLPLQTLIIAMDAAREDLPNPTPISQMDGPDSFPNSDDTDKYGFQRSEMNQSPLAGTVDAYDCHLFLCYKNPESWPPRIEGSESDRLPRLLAAALKSRKNEIQRNTRLTICQGRDGTESSNGDVLIFPDMIRYRGLTHFDADNFVEDVLVKGKEWNSGKAEALTGSHVFVCSHGSRDRRCGVCGPALIKKLEEDIELQGLKDQVFVSPCSHIGGHKYAGNLIIFSLNVHGEVTGHWYGYVTPDDIPILLDQHISKGKIVHRLWRGQMGLSDAEQKKALEQRLEKDGEEIYSECINTKKREEEAEDGSSNSNKDGTSCCQGANGLSCCRDEKRVDEDSSSKGIGGNGGKSLSKKGTCMVASWFKTWEQADTFAALAVVGAVASVAVAYSIYRRSG